MTLLSDNVKNKEYLLPKNPILLNKKKRVLKIYKSYEKFSKKFTP